MIKDFVCKGCKKGPCRVDQTAVRPVLTSNQPSSDLWKYYDFVRDYQCMEVINSREDLFWCDDCGFIVEDHMRNILVDKAGYEWQFCPDYFERYIQIQKRAGSTD
ncbi:MAG: hypothetical protein K0R92_784 [Lachnospiraceae bacterium]|nr:hypothetical protein [Lachnospiraceae bacterium]